jgi:hypothetical protein
MLLKTLILLKMKNGEDMRDHIRNFFDVVDKLEEMELCIINDLLASFCSTAFPTSTKIFEFLLKLKRNYHN